MVDQYVPAGHLLTINNWRQAKKASEWYSAASNVWYGISALFSPISTGARYLASRAGISTPWQLLQKNLIIWFYTAFVHRVGTYLIDLQSGRLRVGARRFRELMAGQTAAADGAAEAGPKQVTVALVGQTKAGKSSLVNALLGEERAKADVLPVKDGIERYELRPKDVPATLALLDTVGYGESGPKADQLAATQEAARGADLILLVLHARTAARQADVAMLEALRAWFAAHAELKMPPVVAVLTHIDLLSPSLEWAPPYDWKEGRRPKERSIHACVEAAREGLGERVAVMVPVCAAPGKVTGVIEELLPEVLKLLDEARGVALLRALRAEADAGKVRKVFHQLIAVGREGARAVWQALTAK
jgi:predicted GTPase